MSASNYFFEIGVSFLDAPFLIILAMVLAPGYYAFTETKSVHVILMWVMVSSVYLLIATGTAPTIGWVIYVLLAMNTGWSWIMRFLSISGSGPGQRVSQ